MEVNLKISVEKVLNRSLSQNHRIRPHKNIMVFCQSRITDQGSGERDWSEDGRWPNGDDDRFRPRSSGTRNETYGPIRIGLGRFEYLRLFVGTYHSWSITRLKTKRGGKRPTLNIMGTRTGINGRRSEPSLR